MSRPTAVRLSACSSMGCIDVKVLASIAAEPRRDQPQQGFRLLGSRQGADQGHEVVKRVPLWTHPKRIFTSAETANACAEKKTGRDLKHAVYAAEVSDPWGGWRDRALSRGRLATRADGYERLTGRRGLARENSNRRADFVRKILARWERLELSTDGLENRCSVQLSYHRIKNLQNRMIFLRQI